MSGPLLESLAVIVPAAAVAAYERALATCCESVSSFVADEAAGTWRVEGTRPPGAPEPTAALALAAMLSGVAAPLERARVASEGWLARVYDGFPEQVIGRRFAVRGAHWQAPTLPARITLLLDAGVAFGSGEHPSTRGCLLAFEAMAHRRPRRILDIGCGSGILAIAAARLLRRRVLAVDIDPWSVRTAAANAAANGVRVQARAGHGYRTPAVRAAVPFDLVFANILARPLMRLAPGLAAALAPGGTAILAGLLSRQARAVLVAHRRAGLRLERTIEGGQWTTLVLRR